MSPGAKAPGLKLKNKMASLDPNSKTRWRRWAQTQKQDGVVVEKQDGVVCRDDIKEVCWFRLVEVGILSGCNILLKRMDLRRSYPPRPPSAARAAVWVGKAMGFIWSERVCAR